MPLASALPFLPPLHSTAVEARLEAQGVDGAFGKEVGAAGHFQPDPGGAAIECGKARLGGLLSCGLVRVDVPVGVHRRQAIRRLVVLQFHHLERAAVLVQVLGTQFVEHALG